MGTRPIPIGPTGESARANIRALREARCLTTRQLAALLTAAGRPFTATAITRVEHGQRRIDVDDLTAFAAALRVKPSSLLAGPTCMDCHDAPPSGFSCNTCGATSA